MTDRAEQDKRADRQEEEEVRQLRKAGYVAYRVDREIDTYASKDGKIWLCDNKYTDNDLFYIDYSDVAKGLDAVLAHAKSLNFAVPIYFRVWMHFARHRSKNKKYISIREDDRGFTIKVERTSTGRFVTSRVRRGKC